MRPNPLSIRVMALSWAVALFAWPLAWLLLAVAPGIGVVLAGGEWIGVALPLGLHPQAVVNEPTVAFAATRAALSLYWLAPSLASLGFSLAVPTLLPVPRGWFAELAVFQLGFAAATLGLGWAPPLGQADGPAAAMARFWEVRPALFLHRHRACRNGGHPCHRLGGFAFPGPRQGATVGSRENDQQPPPGRGGCPPHAAPRPEKTAGRVRTRILASSQSDQLSM